MTSTAARDRISRPPPIIVATTGWAIAGRSPGGRPLRRRRETVVIYGRPRLRGTAALQAATDHRCHDRVGHCWADPWRASAPSAPWECCRFNLRPAAAPRGPAAPTEHRCHDPMQIAGRFPGRPLRPSLENEHRQSLRRMLTWQSSDSD
jgi:hypothetical protein